MLTILSQPHCWLITDCGNGVRLDTRGCYQVHYVDQMITWQEALNDCVLSGKALVNIEDDGEYDAIVTYLVNNAGAWGKCMPNYDKTVWFPRIPLANLKKNCVLWLTKMHL